MSKAQAAQTFSVSRSSVKRYVYKAHTSENRWLRRRGPDLFRSSTTKPSSSWRRTSKSVPLPPSKIAATTWRS
jgi:hypothetical protein